MNLSIRSMVVAFVLALAVPAAAVAGPATDKLASCVKAHTSAQDHLVVVTWIYAAIARHPAVEPMANISDDQHARIELAAGQVLNRLMTQDCAAESGEAYREGGNDALVTGVGTLGETAMTDIMTEPHVGAAIGQVATYVDANKLAQILYGPAPK